MARPHDCTNGTDPDYCLACRCEYLEARLEEVTREKGECWAELIEMQRLATHHFRMRMGGLPLADDLAEFWMDKHPQFRID